MKMGWIAALGLTAVVAFAETAWGWEEQFEGGIGAWTTNGTWGLTTAASVSPTHAAADSPSGFYTNRTDASLTLNAGIDLSSFVRPALRYAARYYLEENYDFLAVEGSTNAGASWFLLEALTGTQHAWQRRQVSLASRAGPNPLRLRFRLVSDDSVAMDGAYLDDLFVGEAPAAVGVFTNGSTPTRVDLSWTAPGADFARARVWRSATSNVVPSLSTLVGEVTDPGTTSMADVAVSPKSTYYYAVAVESTNGLETLSAAVQARTAAGMEFPFLDNGEGGGGTWVADAPWDLSAEAAAGGALGWADSPGTDYGDNANVSLTLAAAGSLAGWSRPVLMFRHRYDFLSGDFGYVEASTNAGSSWTALASFTAASSSWVRARYDLSAFAGGPSLLLRFRVTSDASGTADGWRLDDISVSDAPATVPEPAASQIQPTSVRLDWPASDHPALSHYVVVRSLANDPTLNTQPAFVATSNAYADVGLMVDSSYYYRVFAVDAWGGYSAASPTASVVRTIFPVLPVSEGFETNADLWTLQNGWTVSTGEAFSGTCYLENGFGGYSNNLDARAVLSLNLTGAVRPVLRFADWHRLAVNDYGYVEVSAPGRSGLRLYGVYGARTNWEEQVVDLSYYKGCANVQILFRLTTDGSGTDAGWNIDDVRVADEGSPALAVPFVEDFEGGLGNWVETSRWEAASGGYQGAAAAADNLERIAPETRSYFSLGGDFDLTAFANPQLTAWVKGSLGNYSGLNLEVSADGGANWSTPWSRSTESGNFSNAWQRVQVSLAPYKASNARVRWLAYSYYGTLADANVFVDKLTVAEAPPGVGMLPAAPGLKSAQVNWTASGIGPAFQAYRVLRSPDADPNNGNDVIVGAVSNAATTSFADAGLAIGSTYYYWTYVADTNDVWTISTNYAVATTVPVVLPFADAFADAGQWDVTGTWGVDTNAGCLADSPDGDYDNNLNTTAKTAVNLTGAVRPVLRFADWHRLAVNDYGYVEVSAPGRSGLRLYGVYGARTNWEEQVVDLSYYKGCANVQILFRLTTDGSGTDAGWNIDDVRVADEGSPALAVPFVEDFEGGLGNWVETSRWEAASGGYQGAAAAADNLERIAPETRSYFSLGGDFDLTAFANPQLTAWVKGSLGNYSGLNLEVSADGGANWSTPWSRSTESGNFSNAWQRVQVSLAPYKASNARVRWLAYSYYGTLADANVFVDKLTVAEAPPGVGMLPAAPGLKSAQVNWTASGIGPAFQAYRVLRSPDADPNNGNDVIVGAVSNAATTSFADAGLAIGSTYYYWTYVADTNDVWTISTNYAVATTVPVVLPFADAFADAGQWDVTGTWGVDTNAGCLADSPDGDYANGQDTYAQTAVNLIGTVWPVLRFRDACRLAANDFGYVEVSPNGSSYTRVYGVGGAQTNEWAQNEIDLSQWKNQANLRIRFHLTTDGVGTDDGWNIDDVTVSDRGAQTLPVPFYDGFERGRTNWLENTWTISTNQPYAGSNLLAAAMTQVRPEVQARLPLAGSMDLSLTTDPKVTFRVRGYLLPYSALNFQISTDGGINWGTLWSVNAEAGWNTNVWTTQTFSLVSYRYADVRFRFLLNSYYGTLAGVQVAIDHFSLGETTPGAPAPYSPADLANIETIRPTLIVDNAFDPNFDPLTYRFEVYGDEGLSNGILAQVPAVASGTERTSWQVDVNLENSRQYWWRCCASDGSNVGPWTATATFFINETNTPPTTVQIAGPPKGANLRTGAGILSWYPASDSDAGDEIIAYQIQIADSDGFGHVLVDAVVDSPVPAPTGSYVTISRPLNTLSGWNALGMVSNYNWRIRSRDSRFSWSSWSSGVDWFIYGVPPPDLSRIVPGTNGQLAISWAVGTENVRVWFSPSLNPPDWQVIAGPLNDSGYVVRPPTNVPAGFYRVTGQ